MMRDISQLLNMYMVAASLFYGFSMLALLVMRWTKPDVPRPFKVDWSIGPCTIANHLRECSNIE